MVHLRVVPDDRRERAREQRRQQFLDAALRVVDREGVSGVTMQAVADELDCAVGTIYTYFRSKDALIAALEGRAVDALRVSFSVAEPRWAAQLAHEQVPEDLAALSSVLAFGAFWAAASVVLADEFELQRQLLSRQVNLRTIDEARQLLPVAKRLFEQPESLLDRAVDHGVLAPGPSDERVVRWLAAMNGVLLLDHLASVDRHLFRAPHLVRELTGDLLVGWGADRAQVDIAASHVERLGAAGPMAPPPDGPGFS